MTGAAIKNRIILIILALIVIIGAIIVYTGFYKKNEIPSKGVFVTGSFLNLKKLWKA